MPGPEHESVLGMECVLYRNTNEGEDWWQNPTWVAVDNVRDLTLPLKKGQADASTRGSGKWRVKRGTLKEAAINFGMVWAPADAGFQAMRESFFEDTPIDLAIMSGPMDDPDSEGLRAVFEVFDFTRNEELENVVLVDVAIEPTYSSHAPEWINGEEA